MRDAGTLDRFVPFDVSEQTLRDAAAAVAREYAGVRVHAVVGDFEHHLGRPPRRRHARSWRSWAAPSATSRPSRARRFLADLAATLAPGDALLLGTDLVKDVDRLVAAYDDAAGVTAAFNRNVLRVLNRELSRRLRSRRVRARRALRPRRRVDRDASCARPARRRSPSPTSA